MRFPLDPLEHRRRLGGTHPDDAVLRRPLLEHPLRGAEHDHPVDGGPTPHRAALEEGEREVVGGARAGVGVEAYGHLRLARGEVCRHPVVALLEEDDFVSRFGEPGCRYGAAGAGADHADAGTDGRAVCQVSPERDAGGDRRLRRGRQLREPTGGWRRRHPGDRPCVIGGARERALPRPVRAALVQRPQVADRGVRPRQRVVGGERQPAKGLKDRAARREAAPLPGVQHLVLLLRGQAGKMVGMELEQPCQRRVPERQQGGDLARQRRIAGGETFLDRGGQVHGSVARLVGGGDDAPAERVERPPARGGEREAGHYLLSAVRPERVPAGASGPDQMCSGCPSAASAASPTASDSVGCGWIARSISSTVVSRCLPTTNSAINSVACSPTMCAPSSSE
ncbi:hypothetical protein BH23GEM4_BH23GEM4_12390 [soil metagenome]